MSNANPASVSDSGERLTAFLAPQIVAEDLPALFPLLAARELIAAFSALFHGSEAAVQIRLLVLREIGGRADAPRWSRREIDAHFAFLDATKLETIVKRLTEFGLLLWDGDDRTYRVSAQGHSAPAALFSPLRMAGRHLMCHNTQLCDTSRHKHAYRDHPRSQRRPLPPGTTVRR